MFHPGVQDVENEIATSVSHRRKSRRSSILKPTRGALNDLDPNYDVTEQTENLTKKEKRRVSFAATSQVKEFVKIPNESVNESKCSVTGIDALLTGRIQTIVPLESQIMFEADDNDQPGQDVPDSHTFQTVSKDEVTGDNVTTGDRSMKINTLSFLKQLMGGPSQNQSPADDKTQVFQEGEQMDTTETYDNTIHIGNKSYCGSPGSNQCGPGGNSLPTGPGGSSVPPGGQVLPCGPGQVYDLIDDNDLETWRNTTANSTTFSPQFKKKINTADFLSRLRSSQSAFKPFVHQGSTSRSCKKSLLKGDDLKIDSMNFLDKLKAAPTILNRHPNKEYSSDVITHRVDSEVEFNFSPVNIPFTNPRLYSPIMNHSVMATVKEEVGLEETNDANPLTALQSPADQTTVNEQSMNITAVIDETIEVKPGLNEPTIRMRNFPRKIEPEKTIIFNQGDNMETTCVIDRTINLGLQNDPQGLKNISHNSMPAVRPGEHKFEPEPTIIFNQGDNMETTCVIDHTINIDSHNDPQGLKNITHNSIPVQSEPTIIFNQGDNMEMTNVFDPTINIGLRKSSVDTSKPNMTIPEHTIIFNQGDNMEVTNVFDHTINLGLRKSSVNASKPNTAIKFEDGEGRSVGIIERKPNMIIDPNTTSAMELTVCVGNECGSEEKTQCSSEDRTHTAAETMEMTCAVNHTIYCDQNTADVVDATASLLQGMDTTKCIGGIRQTKDGALDQTITYGSALIRDPNVTRQISCVPDRTIRFEQGEGMEMTRSIGGIEGLEINTNIKDTEKTNEYDSGHSSSLKEAIAGVANSMHLSSVDNTSGRRNKTIMFAQGEGMEMTHCVGNIICDQDILDTASSSNAAESFSSFNDKTYVTKPNTSETIDERSSKRPQRDSDLDLLTAEVKRPRLDDPLMVMSDVLLKGQDAVGVRSRSVTPEGTYVIKINNDIGLISSEDSGDVESTNQTQTYSSKDQTKTISTNQDATMALLGEYGISANQESSSKEQTATIQDATMALLGEYGILDELPLDFLDQDSVSQELHAQLEENGIFKSSTILDHPASDRNKSSSACNQSVFAKRSFISDHTATVSIFDHSVFSKPSSVSDQSAASNMSCDDRGHSIFEDLPVHPLSMLSVIDEKTEKQLIGLPGEGSITVEQFFQYVGMSSFCDLMPAARHSTIMMGNAMPPESMSERLKLLAISKPEHHYYKWFSEKLEKHIAVLKKSNKSTQERLSCNNPEIFHKVRNCTTEELTFYKSKLAGLKKCCQKKSRMTFKKFKGKMLESIITDFKDEKERMGVGLKEVDDVTQEVDQHLQIVATMENDIDEQLSELTGNEDDSTDYSYKDTSLHETEIELTRKNEERESLKRIRDDLKASLVQSKDRASKLQSFSEQKLQLEKLYDQVERMQSYAEYRLVEKDDTRVKFTFLYGSLGMTILLGEPVHQDPLTHRDIRKITAVKFKSFLADDSKMWAHLAHRMVLDYVRPRDLEREYKSTQDLPKLMNEMSDVVINARILGDEIQELGVSHLAKVNGTRLTLLFSSLKTLVNVLVHIDLVPGQYPKERLAFEAVHNFGPASMDEIRDTVDSVTPGLQYITRIVAALDTLLMTKT